MFEDFQDALNFYLSLESKQAIMSFVADNCNELQDWEVSVASIALARK